MNPLINLNDIRSIKSISLNLNSEKELNPHILEAQKFDLRPFLKDDFYLSIVEDLEASPSLTEYADLWNGCVYTYGSEKFIMSGLKAILCYHSYARYLPHSDIQSTATGFVRKSNQYSEKIEDKTISRLIAQARSAATVMEGEVLDYLNRNSSLYPKWKGNQKNKSSYSSGMKIRSIG